VTQKVKKTPNLHIRNSNKSHYRPSPMLGVLFSTDINIYIHRVPKKNPSPCIIHHIFAKLPQNSLKFPPHIKGAATLPCKILFFEKLHKPMHCNVFHKKQSSLKSNHSNVDQSE